jgi:regulator of nonsense transcripts 2
MPFLPWLNYDANPQFIGEVPKNRTDLLPHYARLIATLNPYMPDIGSGVIEILDEELRYLQRKKLVKELDSVRMKVSLVYDDMFQVADSQNVRFYGELAKFKVAQPFTILHVLKVFLDDFKSNIDNISNLLETCGRFLLRYEGTAVTAKNMVELMRRKQGNSHLDQRQQIALENAFHTVR